MSLWRSALLQCVRLYNGREYFLCRGVHSLPQWWCVNAKINFFAHKKKTELFGSVFFA